jgi:hypothetical protein
MVVSTSYSKATITSVVWSFLWSILGRFMQSTTRGVGMGWGGFVWRRNWMNGTARYGGESRRVALRKWKPPNVWWRKKEKLGAYFHSHFDFAPMIRLVFHYFKHRGAAVRPIVRSPGTLLISEIPNCIGQKYFLFVRSLNMYNIICFTVSPCISIHYV